MLLILLLAGQQRTWKAAIPLTILLASLALANEVDFVCLYFGIVLAAILWLIRNKTVQPPPSARLWIVVAVLAGVVALVQGGLVTEVLRARFSAAGTQTASYFKVGFSVVPPTIVSSHLGKLSLLHPLQLLVALFEIGPVVLVLPLVLVWGYKALRDERWFQAALVASILPSLLSILVQYSGNAGPTATTRLLSNLFFVCKLLAVPLVWSWLQNQPEWKHHVAYGLGLVAMFSGVVLFAIQLIVIPRPVYTYFLTEMDAYFYQEYWDRLSPPSAWVFDPSSARAETVFGRQAHTSAGQDWAVYTSEYAALVEDPDPYRLNAAGYRYLYADKAYWKEHAARLDQPCVQIVETVEGVKEVHGDNIPDFRQLAILSQCK
jgi:hypothetical protein